MSENRNVAQAAQANPFAVDYEVNGTRVKLDLNFVKRYLVRGSAQVTDQEVMLFLATCSSQKLNPLTNEVYLIKYGSEPAQIVVAKNAYARRAYENPDYIGQQNGITVERTNGDIVQKEGTCVYPSEKLVGGWCRVYYMRHGREHSYFEEVALDEYNKGKSTWRQMPATMISKTAQAHALRAVFPREYNGLYSEDEMITSGAIPVEAIPDGGDDRKPPALNAAASVKPAERVTGQNDRPISQEQRQVLFKTAQNAYGKDAGNQVLKELLETHGLKTTTGMPTSKYNAILMDLMEKIEKKNAQESAAEPAGEPAAQAQPEAQQDMAAAG